VTRFDKPGHKALLGDLEILSNHCGVIQLFIHLLATTVWIHKLLMLKLYPVLAAFVKWVTDGNGR